jgi:membrane protein
VAEPATTQDDAPAKPGLKDRLKARYQDIRDRVPVVDHFARAFEHYSAAQASMLSGAATYFGLLSFFPILALVFAILGFVVQRYPEAQEPVLEAMRNVLPGLFDQLDTEQIANAATAASIIGFVGFLYTGLGWLSSLRGGVQLVFAIPKSQRGNFLVGKVFDLIVLCLIGVVLLITVASSSLVTTLTGELLASLGLDDVSGMSYLVRALGIVVGILASTLLFYVIYRLLGRPALPGRALLEGSLLAAIGFEVLKLVATFVIGGILDNPIYGPFALVIALTVWISYFARLVMLGAAWAATTAPADKLVETRLAEEAERALIGLRPAVLAEAPGETPRPRRNRGALLAGAVLGAAAVGVVVWLRALLGPAERDG